jgi:hypothetical protein
MRLSDSAKDENVSHEVLEMPVLWMAAIGDFQDPGQTHEFGCRLAYRSSLFIQ